MFKCEECGCYFEVPRKGYDEEKDSCPICGSWGFDEIEPCTICGEDCTDESGFCEHCIDEAKDMLRIDFNHFGDQRMSDMIDLFTVALEKLNEGERRKR